MKDYRSSEAGKDTCSQDTDERALFRAETGLEAQSRHRRKRNLSHTVKMSKSSVLPEVLSH